MSQPISNQPRVFLDTSVLLKALSATRKQAPLPGFLTDADAERLTFEKCVYEAYLAFRGIGGKKPDEGRGRWAERNLDPAADPLPLSQLANRFHGQNLASAHLWVNLIEEAAADLEGDEEWIHQTVKKEDRPAALAELQHRRELAQDTGRFWRLCTEFRQVLHAHRVRVLSYLEVFSLQAPSVGSSCDPRMLDGLFQSVTLPAEDFEIVYAALRADADLFVTDDHRLRRSSFSLGLHLPLSVGGFCAAAEYEERAAAWRQEHSPDGT